MCMKIHLHWRYYRLQSAHQWKFCHRDISPYAPDVIPIAKIQSLLPHLDKSSRLHVGRVIQHSLFVSQNAAWSESVA
jgi:hypothetical protein